MSRINSNTVAFCIVILRGLFAVSGVAALLLTAVAAHGQTSKPQPRPTLKETLGWIQDSLKSYGDIEKETARGTEIHALRLADFSGCRVHFVLTENVAGNETYYRAESSFNLGDIDPENGGFTSLGISRPGFFRAVTQNAIDKIAEKTISPLVMEFGTSLFIVELYGPYGSDFANAFKHAVKICGGKPSVFTDSDEHDWDEPAPVAAGGVAAQSAPSRKETQTPAATARSASPRKDIPAIAKAANGAIVSIVMSDKHGKPIALGSGFLVSKDGLIVTNYHVIAEGSSAVVKLPDGTFFVVDGVLASDKHRDVALIKAHGENFRTLALGNSDRVQVGEEVVAIGNPLSLESTVSNGIVSSIRTIDEEGGKYLQVTAPISPGSSGGPLFNMAGEVVGITTMYLKGGENLNFAIPINDAKRLVLAKSSTILPLPNEPEPVEAKTHDGDVPPSVSGTAPPSAPDLKTTAEFMSRMVEPEHRSVIPGELTGAGLHSTNGGLSLTIVSNQSMLMVFPSSVIHEHGYSDFKYSVLSDSDGGHTSIKDFPRYMSFSLGDIDPSSIQSEEGGYDIDALSGFYDKHPNCMPDPQCAHEYLSFLDSAPRLTKVLFHTTDLKPLIERGGFESCSENEKSGGCQRQAVPTGTVNIAVIFFKDKDRAERFVTALTYAVKLEGGKPDLFPPAH